MTGFQVEDSCRCPDDGTHGYHPHYDPDCPAHGGRVRDIAQQLAAWNAGMGDMSRADIHRILGAAVAALGAVLEGHWRHEPAGPTPGPLPGVCATCGNTGMVHGPGQNGNWTGEECGCQTPFCGGCGGEWPCTPVQILGEAVELGVPR